MYDLETPRVHPTKIGPGDRRAPRVNKTMKLTGRVIPCLALAVALLCCCAPARAQAIQGDLNGDGFVGALDIQIILTHWGQTVTPGDTSKGDVFADGFIGITDLTFLLLNWGQGDLPTPGGDAALGMNLHEVAYWSREWVFVDAVKTAREWVSTNPNGNPFDSGQPVAVDADGWPVLQPGQAAHTIMLVEKAGYPAGTYVVTYEGSGSLAFGFDAQNVQTTGPNRMTFQVNSATKSGILMRVIANNPGDHITNIRVWMPGFEGAASPFHPMFVDKLQPFGVLRFMDWQQTNGSNQVAWDDRPKTTDFSMDTDSGVALEYMIKLCNELDADAWFCMPHTADDNYVRRFAVTVRYGDPANNIPKLKDGLNVYVEWSNEVWNVQFGQSKWVDQNSAGGVFSEGFMQKWAQEAANDFAIWHDVFSEDYQDPADEDQRGRIIRVAAGQQANVWVTERLTEELDALGSPYDAIACAAYFDQRKTQFDASTTPQDIIDNAINETIPNIYTGYYQDHGELSQRLTNERGRPIPLLAYEAGQHYTVHGNAGASYFQAFKDVQTYENNSGGNGMYEAYIANMEAFDQAGGSLYMAFNFVSEPGPYGSWGHLQFQDESAFEAPKYRALLDFNSE